MSGNLKRYLREGYLAGCSAWTKHRLGTGINPRRFDRVAIVAAYGKQNGITRGAFLQWQALRRLGIDATMVDATPGLRNPFYRLPHDPATAYIFHSGAPQTASLIGAVMPHARDAYRIGYWAWELPDPPPDWAGCDDSLHEIWTPSRFSRDSLVRMMRKPVEVVPHYLPPEPARLRIDGAPFTVLTMADSRSSLSRKNPEGAVRAFVAAFGQSTDARLLLKISAKDEELQAFDAQLGGLLSAPNIEIIREFMTEDALSALYASADVLLSLHRSEGFGLPMLEAQAHGVPVVATGWSGNMDFTTTENSILVPYDLVPVDDAAAVYRGSHWAEPDVTAAADALRRLADDKALHTRLADAAYRGCADQPIEFPLAPVALAA
ncbi:glycosyltransferase family 4 protein [Acidisoma cellulosilytica]|uniref:Glycosyltransferase family 4 protein n=1 Tax=Acidisoma cellulosilyticum TaxID=2802395 RepID=A0A963Z4R9_9PROT|nr:glycosyltransferase family 4 protein [Acidisoma cellulosilyticum]MCB8881753.1 glycosyltransferase family 4 protein [Acidisoma cellulosilyticum]